MNTQKMIADIKETCTSLESEKANLMTRVKAIDDELTGYRMAIDALELTMTSKKAVEVAKAEPAPKKKTNSATVLEFNGERHTIREWAKALGMTPGGIHYRLAKGWSVESALSKPKAPGNYNRKKKAQKAKKVFAYDAHDNVIRQYFGVNDASKDLHLPASTVQKIIEKCPKEDQIRVRNYYLAYAT